MNHKYTCSYYCDLSVLSPGSSATRSPSSRSPFPTHHYSPLPSSLSIFSPLAPFSTWVHRAPGPLTPASPLPLPFLLPLLGVRLR